MSAEAKGLSGERDGEPARPFRGARQGSQSWGAVKGPSQGDPSPSGSPLSVADGQPHPGLSEALPRATSATHRISSW